MSFTKAAIFDLDGTLLDTIEDIADSANASLEHFGFMERTVDEYRFLVGDGVNELIKRALPKEARNDKTIKDCLAFFLAEFDKRWNVKTKPYEGIEKMLKDLEKAGVMMVIFSNKPHNFTVEAANYYFPEIKFAVVLGAKDEIPRKPDAGGVHHVASLLRLSKDNFIFIGDTKVDVQTAKNAGVISVGAAWGFRGREELEKAGADFIIEGPSQLMDVIETLEGR